LRIWGKKTIDAVVARICDSCEKKEDRQEYLDEWLTYQDQVGYFGKHFRDMDSLTLDLCEQCKFDLLGKYIKVTKHFDIHDMEVIDMNSEIFGSEDDA
jgi:hypothetical protein